MIYNVLIPHLRDHLMADTFTVKDGILYAAADDYSIICVIWIIVFLAMLMIGRKLHDNIWAGYRVDWFSILALIPAVVILIHGNETFTWTVWLLFALYLHAFYRRLSGIFDKPILTLISVCIAVAWWTQPLIAISDLFITEWRILGFMLLCFVISKVIYRSELSGGPDIMYWASVASVIWQSVSAVRSAELFDVMLLGIVLLVVLIVSFEKRSRQWFMLSTISLVCIFLYMSRDFWRRIVWPVYVFAIGIVLIFLAARNEYRKKHPGTATEKKKFFDGWNK
jgi:hypothetical protein